MNPTESSTKPRVLLVDDDEFLRQVLAMSIRGWGYDCVEAALIREARAALEENPAFAAIVADGLLPDGSGLDFIEWLRGKSVSAPVVFISGSVRPPDFKGQGVEYLPKPFQLAEFRGLLERLTSGAA